MTSRSRASQRTRLSATAVLLALGAVTAAPAARAAEGQATLVAQAENPCGGARKRSSNPCAASNPCGPRRQRKQSD